MENQNGGQICFPRFLHSAHMTIHLARACLFVVHSRAVIHVYLSVNLSVCICIGCLSMTLYKITIMLKQISILLKE